MAHKSKRKSKLKQMRICRGMLQCELAELSGVTQASISRMERCGLKRADKALAVAKALHCTIEEIYD